MVDMRCYVNDKKTSGRIDKWRRDRCCCMCISLNKDQWMDDGTGLSECVSLSRTVDGW